jgi:LmbE family N-acetylglucosaminyl deacetylase
MARSLFLARTALRLAIIAALVLSASVFIPFLESSARTGTEPTAPSFFVVAHPDDWQLFMGDVAATRMASGKPVVFIYLTAGGSNRPERYWRARERGAHASVYAAENLNALGDAEYSDPACGEVLIHGHNLYRCQYSNAVSYHFRLPDGNMDGAGFSMTGFQSLEKLEFGRGKTLQAVDGSAIYADWVDLRATLRGILLRELKGHSDHFEVHSHDPDAASNPDDHPDHTAVARLVGEATAGMPATITGYAGYNIAQRPINLSTKAAGVKALLFMSYDRQRLMENAYWSAYVEQPFAYSAWLFRTYGRTLRNDGAL